MEYFWTSRKYWCVDDRWGLGGCLLFHFMRFREKSEKDQADPNCLCVFFHLYMSMWLALIRKWWLFTPSKNNKIFSYFIEQVSVYFNALQQSTEKMQLKIIVDQINHSGWDWSELMRVLLGENLLATLSLRKLSCYSQCHLLFPLSPPKFLWFHHSAKHLLSFSCQRWNIAPAPRACSRKKIGRLRKNLWKSLQIYKLNWRYVEKMFQMINNVDCHS